MTFCPWDGTTSVEEQTELSRPCDLSHPLIHVLGASSPANSACWRTVRSNLTKSARSRWAAHVRDQLEPPQILLKKRQDPLHGGVRPQESVQPDGLARGFDGLLGEANSK